MLSTDIKEYPSYYLLEVEVPGVTKGNVDISVENGYLTVAMTKTDKNDGTVEFYKNDVYVGSTTYTGTPQTFNWGYGGSRNMTVKDFMIKPL